MAQVHPFPAYRYNAGKVAYDLVLTQPYDKISPGHAGQVLRRRPAQFDRHRKGPRPSRRHACWRAQRKKRLHARGRRSAKLDPRTSRRRRTRGRASTPTRRSTPCRATQQRLTRRGFIGAGKLEEYSAGVVFRHEHTLSGPKADRLELLRHTQTHTGQLFLLYSDAERVIDKILAQAESESAPATELTDEYNVIHRFWVVWQPERIAAIHKAMADQKLVIADGHHRYETALNYRNERRKENAREQGSPRSRRSARRDGIESVARRDRAQPLARGRRWSRSRSDGRSRHRTRRRRIGFSRHRNRRVARRRAHRHPTTAPPPSKPRPTKLPMMTFVNTRSEGLTILPTHRVVANIPDFSWATVRRYLEPWFAAEIFTFSSDDEKSAARDKFLNRLVEARESRAIGVYPAPEKPAQRRLLLRSHPSPRRQSRPLLPNVSPLQRELDVVLLHDGILEPALGVTLAAATAEKNLTYEREASAALDAVDRRPPRSLSCSTPAASTKPGTSRPPAKSCRKNPPTFSPN